MTRESPPRRPTLTLRDVAAAASVSEMTVSRVLRGSADVSAGTRERVLTAARTLGYVPNRIAGALASQRVALVAVIVPSLSNMVFPEVVDGISEGLEGTGLQPVMGVSGYDPAREEAVLYQMLSWRPSGVILAGLEHSDAARAMLRAADLPVVEIMDVDGTAIDAAVGISHRAAGADIARAILSAGYRRVAYAGPAGKADHRARKRLEGFRAVLAEAGTDLVAEARYEGGSTLAQGRAMSAALLAQAPELDCMYFANDLIGAGSLLHCLDQGLDVPGRIGLAGFNGLDLLNGLPMRLATTDACRRETGRRAAALVAATAAAGTAGGQRIVLSPRLNRGDTLRRTGGD